MACHRCFLIPVLLISVLTSTTASATTSWVYLVKTYPLIGNDQALSQVLNKLGKQDWELVTCTEGNAELTCIFKRPADGDQ